MEYEILSFFFIIFLNWYFNVRKNNFITSKIPKEKMTNIFVFDNNF